MSSKKAAAPTTKHADDDLDGNFAMEPISSGMPHGDSSDASDVEAVAGAGVPTAKVENQVVSGKKRKRSEIAEAKAPSAEEKSPEEIVSTFWSAFMASKTGSRLTDLEISSPLNPSHIATIPSAVVPTMGTPTLDVSDLPAAIKAALPKWKRVFGWKGGAKKRPSGQPEVIIITYSAVRAASMLKPLAFFNTRIAKLFAKHLSVDEQKEILKGPPVTIAVGTSNRIQKLLDEDALSLASTTLIMLDIHPDMKKFTLLNHPNLREDVFTLYRDYIHPKVVEGRMKLAFY